MGIVVIFVAPPRPIHVLLRRKGSSHTSKKSTKSKILQVRAHTPREPYPRLNLFFSPHMSTLMVVLTHVRLHIFRITSGRVLVTLSCTIFTNSVNHVQSYRLQNCVCNYMSGLNMYVSVCACRVCSHDQRQRASCAPVHQARAGQQAAAAATATTEQVSKLKP